MFLKNRKLFKYFKLSLISCSFLLSFQSFAQEKEFGFINYEDLSPVESLSSTVSNFSQFDFNPITTDSLELIELKTSKINQVSDPSNFVLETKIKKENIGDDYSNYEIEVTNNLNVKETEDEKDNKKHIKTSIYQQHYFDTLHKNKSFIQALNKKHNFELTRFEDFSKLIKSGEYKPEKTPSKEEQEYSKYLVETTCSLKEKYNNYEGINLKKRENGHLLLAKHFCQYPDSAENFAYLMQSDKDFYNFLLPMYEMVMLGEEEKSGKHLEELTTQFHIYKGFNKNL